jgi:hypothetical protein
MLKYNVISILEISIAQYSTGTPATSFEFKIII